MSTVKSSTAPKTAAPPPPPPPASSHPAGYHDAPAASAVQAGTAAFKRGDAGQDVASLQKQLNAAGIKPPLAEDGLLGPKTEKAIKDFQAKAGIGVDGQAGKATLAALQRTTGTSSQDAFQSGAGQHAQVTGGNTTNRAPTQEQLSTTPPGTQRAGSLADAARARGTTGAGGAFAPEPGRATGPFAADSASRTQQAEQILKANGQYPLKEGHTYAIQIDQDQPPAGASSKDKTAYLHSYSGQTAVFTVQNGQLVEKAGPLKSASHPGQKSTSSFTDVNGDGKSDIAHLRGGAYEYNARTYNGRFNPKNNKDIHVARDLNQDGVISGDAENNSKFYATGLQWHAGGSSRPSSVGCQTMPPGDFSQFKDAVSGGDGSFTYVLARRPNDQFGESGRWD